MAIASGGAGITCHGSMRSSSADTFYQYAAEQLLCVRRCLQLGTGGALKHGNRAQQIVTTGGTCRSAAVSARSQTQGAITAPRVSEQSSNTCPQGGQASGGPWHVQAAGLQNPPSLLSIQGFSPIVWGGRDGHVSRLGRVWPSLGLQVFFRTLSRSDASANLLAAIERTPRLPPGTKERAEGEARLPAQVVFARAQPTNPTARKVALRQTMAPVYSTSLICMRRAENPPCCVLCRCRKTRVLGVLAEHRALHIPDVQPCSV